MTTETVPAYTNGKVNVWAEVVTVTPEMAGEWLKRNYGNRKLRQADIEKYARQIEEDRWEITGEAVKFDANNNLRDGQHRLMAILHANRAMDTLVVHGIRDEAFDVIDTGRNRTAGDVLYLHGHGDVSDGMATIARQLIDWNSWGDIRNSTPSKVQPNNNEVLVYAEQHPEIEEALDTALQIFSAGLPKRVQVWGAVLTRFLQIDRNATLAFAEKIIIGAELAVDDPVLLLRNRMIRQKSDTKRLHNDELAALIIKAWNAYRRNESMYQLRWTRGGPKPEAFPVPV